MDFETIAAIQAAAAEADRRPHKRTIQVAIADSALSLLDAIAHAADVDTQSLVRIAVDEYLRRQSGYPPRGDGMHASTAC